MGGIFCSECDSDRKILNNAQKCSKISEKGEMSESAQDLSLRPQTRYLVLYNIAKINNVRNLCITAGSLGYAVIIVGKAHKELEEMSVKWCIDSGTLEVQRTATLETLATQCKAENLLIYGIEIMEEAKSILDPETMAKIPAGQHAIMPGNEGSGLNGPQKRVCSASGGFLYIPHYGDGTASLNVNVATATIMHTIAFPIQVQRQ